MNKPFRNIYHTVRKRLKACGATALSLLYPDGCMVCGEPPAPGLRYFCWECMADMLTISPPFCRRCGNPVSGRIDHEYDCYTCTRHPRQFDRARSAAYYEGPVARAIHRLKYGRQLYLASDLGLILKSACDVYYADTRYDAVGYVPLHHAKRRERGFNQSAALAHNLSRRMSIPLLRNGIRKTRHTPSQTGFNAEGRRNNVKDAFVPVSRKWLENRTLLLVDDVMTTGATVDACARALKAGGAAGVDVLTLARRAER